MVIIKHIKLKTITKHPIMADAKPTQTDKFTEEIDAQTILSERRRQAVVEHRVPGNIGV